MLEKITLIAVFTFLLLWGYKSFQAGIKNINRSYWFVSFGTQTSKQVRFLNIVGGGIAIICSVIGIVFYLSK